MKKSVKNIFFSVVLIAIFLSILFIMPTHLFAQSYTSVDVFPGVAGENTQINVDVDGYYNSYYTLVILKFNGSGYVPYGSPWNGTVDSTNWSQSFNVLLPSGSYQAYLTVQSALPQIEYFYITTCYYEDEAISGETSWSYTTPCGNSILQIYIWVDGNDWLMTSDGASPSIIVSGIGTSTVTVNEAILDVEKIRYYFNCCSNTESEPVVWVRTMPMTCYQVWINEDNNFQFVFWYPYRDNNWVKIYDMSGKEVFSIDMPIDNPNLIVDLPDGFYTVKTFNLDPTTPIQTFIIGKP